MIPGMNQKAIQQAMKKMGMKQEEIDASEVIIKKRDGSNLIVRDPSVVQVDMMGQKTLQVTGEMSEESGISDEDVKTVAEQAEVSESEARKSLEKHNGDLAEAILSLKNNK